MLNIPRVAQYARFSSDNQRSESIDAQIRAMNQFCKQNHWQVVSTYTDEARSATTDNRPQFQQMITDSSKGLFDIVLVHKLDRFSRDRYDSAIYRKKLKRNKVRLCSVQKKSISSMTESNAPCFLQRNTEQKRSVVRDTSFFQNSEEPPDNKIS